MSNDGAIAPDGSDELNATMTVAGLAPVLRQLVVSGETDWRHGDKQLGAAHAERMRTPA